MLLKNICLLCVPLKSPVQSAKQKRVAGFRALKRKRGKMRGRIKALQALNPLSGRLCSMKSNLCNLDAKIKKHLKSHRLKEEAKAIQVYIRKSFLFL